MTFHEDVELSSEMVEAFAVFSGDRNPLHLQTESALAYGYAHPVAHGAIQSAVVSKLIGMKVPGPGAVWMSQSMEWLRPAFVGETIRVEAEVESVSAGAEVMTLVLRAINRKGEKLMQGTAKVKMAVPIAEQDARDDVLEARVALVTGASRGIGAAAVRALAQAGFHVALGYKSDHAKAELLKLEVEGMGGRAACFAVDLMKPRSGAALVRQVEELFGRLDVVVHAATQPLPGSTALETSSEELESWIRIQVGAGLEIAQAVAFGMTERGYGRMIFLGTSLLFGQPRSKVCAYVVSKQALWGAVRCLATELGPHRITVNMVSPGMTVTDLTSDIPQRIKEVEARRVPVRRLAVPDDSGKLIAFLASEGSSYLTGQNFPLTGGPV